MQFCTDSPSTVHGVAKSLGDGVAMPIRNTFRCDVSWQEMTPVTSGFRHCAQCDRVVADLRWASAEEAARWLELQGGRGCAQMLAAPDGTALFRKGVLLAAGALSITAVGVSMPLSLLTLDTRKACVDAVERKREARAAEIAGRIDPQTLAQLQALGGYVTVQEPEPIQEPEVTLTLLGYVDD